MLSFSIFPGAKTQEEGDDNRLGSLQYTVVPVPYRQIKTSIRHLHVSIRMLILFVVRIHEQLQGSTIPWNVFIRHSAVVVYENGYVPGHRKLLGSCRCSAFPHDRSTEHVKCPQLSDHRADVSRCPNRGRPSSQGTSSRRTRSIGRYEGRCVCLADMACAYIQDVRSPDSKGPLFYELRIVGANVCSNDRGHREDNPLTG